ncbi:ATP-binding protein [Paracidovorax citrulli]|uniref:ATP-binding protein n=3 Tax=Paracidovorax citrulli TaxID=80869 RepID=UPI001D185534|nr:ATP-binding protein [Paracidovorax citrulli]UEG46335.1 ATP-binding protein [Paracidovorax citrulli]
MNPTALRAMLESLRSLPREQAVVEFKSNLADPEKIGAYISGLANTAALQGRDRAWLVWGVEDGSHRVLGTVFDPFGQKIGNQSLQMWLQVMTQPRADFAFHELDCDGLRVVMLEIHSARAAPMAFQHTRYIRVDSHLVKLADYPSHEARLWNALGTSEDWTGVVVPEATLHDLDPQAVAAARVRYAEYLVRGEPDASKHEAIRTEVAALTVPTLLNKARVTKQGRVTRAALLLLGKDESSHFLAPADAKIPPRQNSCRLDRTPVFGVHEGSRRLCSCGRRSAWWATRSVVHGKRAGARSASSTNAQPCRCLQAPARCRVFHPGGEEREASWHDTDKHSKTERWAGCCHRTAPRPTSWRVRSA